MKGEKDVFNSDEKMFDIWPSFIVLKILQTKNRRELCCLNTMCLPKGKIRIPVAFTSIHPVIKILDLKKM